MHDFTFKSDDLYCEGVKVSSIAKAVGTPFYLYSYKTLVDHYRKIKEAFKSVNPLICYAMKANGNLAVIKALLKEGAGIDIVSGGEFRKALKLRANPKKIVYASVGKTESEIELALRKGILLFNVESLPELEQINKVAKRLRKKAQAAIRINPDVEAATHQFITTGTLKNKFGIDLQSAQSILSAQKKFSNVRINGIHIHIGSQIVTSQPFINAIQKVIVFIENLRRQGIDVEYLDIGGGMGIIYKDESAQTAQQFATAVLPLLKKISCKIIMEPGRFIVGNAGIFVTKVLYVKDNGFKKFVIVDGGMNDLIRPSLYGAYHEITPLKQTTTEKEIVDVVGPICESGDFLAKERLLPKVKQNELLAVMSAGAYGYSMSSNYNARGRVAEVMVKGKKFYVVSKRETFDDLIRRERIPGFLK